MDKIQKIILDYIEDVLILLSLVIFNISIFMFVGVFAGLMVLSITLFLCGIIITIFKMKRR